MKNIIRKLIIISMLLTLVGCSSQQDSINKDINENNGSYNQVEFVQASYNDVELEVSYNYSGYGILNYYINASTTGERKGTIQAMVSISCNYFYKIGTLPNSYSGFGSGSSIVNFYDSNVSTIQGMISLNSTAYNVSCNHTKVYVNGVIEK